MDEVNECYLGQSKHLINYMRVNMLPYEVFPLQSVCWSPFLGKKKISNMANDVFRALRARIMSKRLICLRALGKCACNAISTLETQPHYKHTFPVFQTVSSTSIYRRQRSLVNQPHGKRCFVAAIDCIELLSRS